MNHFTDEEEHREVASLFHTKIRELTTISEQEKALKETIIRVKGHSIDTAAKNLAPTDIAGLLRLMEAKMPRDRRPMEKNFLQWHSFLHQTAGEMGMEFSHIAKRREQFCLSVFTRGKRGIRENRCGIRIFI